MNVNMITIFACSFNRDVIKAPFKNNVTDFIMNNQIPFNILLALHPRRVVQRLYLYALYIYIYIKKQKQM